MSVPAFLQDVEREEAADLASRGVQLMTPTSTRCGLVVRIERDGIRCLYPLPPGVKPKPVYFYKAKNWAFAGIETDATTESTGRADAQRTS